MLSLLAADNGSDKGPNNKSKQRYPTGKQNFFLAKNGKTNADDRQIGKKICHILGYFFSSSLAVVHSA